MKDKEEATETLGYAKLRCLPLSGYDSTQLDSSQGNAYLEGGQNRASPGLTQIILTSFLLKSLEEKR